MANILIVSGHTDLKGDSVANKEILAQLEQRLPDAVIDRLSDLYPDYRIDVQTEQAKLEAADVVVLQFPVFWYAMPSLLQKWMEDTFQHGWSHGSTGTALRGKKLVISLTAGAPVELYAQGEAMGHSIDEFFYCSEATAALTGMELAGTVFTGGVSYEMREDATAMQQMRVAASDHVDRLVSLLSEL